MNHSSFIYSSDPGLMIGFHGCEEEVRDKVVLGKTSLRPSTNDWDWLGDGIYFWQNNYERAWDYATNPPPNIKIKKPAVLGAVFSLGNCLDLSDKKWIDLAKFSFENLKKSADSGGIELPANTNPGHDTNSKDKIVRRLDCAVIKNIHILINLSRFKPFDAVKGVFFEGDPLYDGAGFNDKTHIQICIRNPNCIKGYFLPRRTVKWS